MIATCKINFLDLLISFYHILISFNLHKCLLEPSMLLLYLHSITYHQVIHKTVLSVRPGSCQNSGGYSCESPAVFLHTPLEEKVPWGPSYQLRRVLAKGRHLLKILLKPLLTTAPSPLCDILCATPALLLDFWTWRLHDPGWFLF